MISFACISPHPPIILPSVGSPEDRRQVKNTITALKRLGKDLKEIDPELIAISSPHTDWGFDVPLHFLANNTFARIEPFLTKEDSASDHFSAGKQFYEVELKNSSERIALIASGDLSHRLKIDGPYGLHPEGAEFDKTLIDSLKKKDIATILKLDVMYPEAGECGLRSICYMLGILEAAKIDWRADILSYEGPFGVGYLVARLI
jgi:aromatic ring-opening dioxygenase LigB subunit